MPASRTVSIAVRHNAQWRPPPGPVPHTVFEQPCLNFVNSEFLDHTGSGRRYDRIVLPAWRKWFLNRCGLAAEGSIGEADLNELAGLRRRLRRLLEDQTDPTPSDLALFNGILVAAPMTWSITRQRPLQPQLTPAVGGWPAAMAVIVLSYAELAASGELARVKRCGNAHCCYLFFDSTRSATRRWCDAAACGNLVKVRLYRSRRRATGPAGSSKRTGKSAPPRKRRTRARRSA